MIVTSDHIIIHINNKDFNHLKLGMTVAEAEASGFARLDLVRAAHRKHIVVHPPKTKKCHVKFWTTQNIVKYTDEQRMANCIEFVKKLREGLPIAKLKNYSRRDRPDARKVPEGTPLCVADWCWRLYSSPTCEALGLSHRQLACLVRMNDNGASSRVMGDYIANCMSI